MKNCLIIFCFSLLLLNCKNNSTELNKEEKESIQKEISKINQSIISNVAKKDIEKAMEPFWNDSNFIIINTDGTFSDYKTMKENNTEFFKQIISIKKTTLCEQFKFLSNIEVLYTWFGKSEIHLTSNSKLKTDSYIETMLFRKIEDQWKIVYVHESSSNPIQID